MKKNLVPLLGIAFVVAIISTAIFYNLISSKLSASAHANVSARALQATRPELDLPPPVPSGMRAVSVQVADSSGILDMLQPGNRVDIQAVYSKSGSPHEVEMRTVLQNIEVLKVKPEPVASPGRQPFPVVTFLASPADSDTLALADSSARIRLVLRNTSDRETTERSPLNVGNLMRPRNNPPRVRRVQPPTLSPVPGPSSSACAPPTPSGGTQ